MSAKGYPHPPLRGTLSRERERAGARANGHPHPPLSGTVSRERERAGVRAARGATGVKR